MFTVAHLSDPHLGPLPKPSLASLLTKRILGYFSWKVRRSTIHRESILKVLAGEIANSGVDHVVVTGDITNIALPEEFVQATRWLHSLGDADRVSVIPGNHEAYTKISWEHSLAHWSAFMSEGGVAGDGQGLFPYVRKRGPIAIVGVSTAEPTPPFFASGSVGRDQLDRLGAKLSELGAEGVFRIVLIHHPPFDQATVRRKRLSDGQAFRNTIAEHGAELILHGHTHESHRAELTTPRGRAAVLGVTSASASRDKGDGRHARYHLYRIQRVGSSWTVNVEVRQIAEDHNSFIIEKHFSLELAAR